MSSSVVVLILRMKYGQKWKVWVFQMCFAPIPNALRPLHPNLAKCQFSSFFQLFFQKCLKKWSKFRRGVLRDEFLVIFWGKTVQISFQNFSGPLLGRTFLHPLLFLKIVKKWNFTFRLHRRGVLRDEFLRSEKFFHRKV